MVSCGLSIVTNRPRICHGFQDTKPQTFRVMILTVSGHASHWLCDCKTRSGWFLVGGLLDCVSIVQKLDSPTANPNPNPNPNSIPNLNLSPARLSDLWTIGPLDYRTL